MDFFARTFILDREGLVRGSLSWHVLKLNDFLLFTRTGYLTGLFTVPKMTKFDCAGVTGDRFSWFSCNDISNVVSGGSLTNFLKRCFNK